MSIQPTDHPADVQPSKLEDPASSTTPSPLLTRPHAPVHVHTTPKTPKFGEELPLFCERCGYNLNGLPVTRCDACQTLHFRCPECGHHQVINTLRPATQRILGRLRSWAVVWIVFMKLNWFGWILFGWFVYGYEAIRTYRAYSYRLNIDEILGICILAGIFALISRILLMRWKKSWLVGTILGALVILAMMLGGVYRIIDRSQYDDLVGSPGTELEFAL